MCRLDSEGRVHFTRTGGIRLKRYLDETKGRPLQAVWTDINAINSQAKERTGYPTQKPLALLERIIKASSNEGDVVLDPFCGCATACVAAEQLGRRWVGIDISPKAVELVNMRPQAGHGRPVPPPLRHRPHRHSPAHRCRRAQELPAEQARAVRRAGGLVRRLRGDVPVPQLHRGPCRAAQQGRHRPPRQPAAALRRLQLPQGATGRRSTS